MKKIMICLLVVILTLFGAGCDSASNQEANTAGQTDSTTEEAKTLYNIGDTVSTDCLECCLLSVEKEGAYIEVTYSLKNIGKIPLDEAWINPEGANFTMKIAGLSTLDYNDGYIYGGSSQILNTVDNETLSDLQPLGDAITVTDSYDVPDEVWDNTEAPLTVTISLCSNANINEDAEYSEALDEWYQDWAKHTFKFEFKVR